MESNGHFFPLHISEMMLKLIREFYIRRMSDAVFKLKFEINIKVSS